jgi:hypothetical protein
MFIVVNGQPHPLPGPLKLAALLVALSTSSWRATANGAGGEFCAEALKNVGFTQATESRSFIPRQEVKYG